MKNKISAIVLAVGMAAASVSAQSKVQTQQSTQGATDSPHSIKKRLANTLRRLNRKKAEDEYIRELDAEIIQAMNSEISEVLVEGNFEGEAQKSVVVHHETMPVIGIDISDEFFNLSKEGAAEADLIPQSEDFTISLRSENNKSLAALTYA